METYTFEQIVNERKREFDELMVESEKFNELVTYDKKYEGTNNYFFPYRSELSLYYTYANKFKKNIRKLYYKLPFAIFGLHVVEINDQDNIKKEYRDHKGNLILTVNDVNEFKEKLHCFTESPLVKEFQSTYAKKTIAIDRETQLFSCSTECLDFNHDELNIDFQFLYKRADIEGNETVAPRILQIFKETEYNKDSFSEYFMERVERDKDKDFSIKFDKDYNLIPYFKDKEGDNTIESFDMIEDSDEKKFVLSKRIR